jgi:hypothetical protein
MSVPGRDPLHDDHVESAVKLGVNEPLEVGPVAVD